MVSTIVDKVNMALLVAACSGVIWIFTTFVKAEDHSKIHDELDVAIAYGQFYDRLDDYDEAVAEGNQRLAEEYARMMERLRAIICEHDPEWERCNEA